VIKQVPDESRLFIFQLSNFAALVRNLLKQLLSEQSCNHLILVKDQVLPFSSIGGILSEIKILSVLITGTMITRTKCNLYWEMIHVC